MSIASTFLISQSATLPSTLELKSLSSFCEIVRQLTPTMCGLACLGLLATCRPLAASLIERICFERLCESTSLLYHQPTHQTRISPASEPVITAPRFVQQHAKTTSSCAVCAREMSAPHTLSLSLLFSTSHCTHSHLFRNQSPAGIAKTDRGLWVSPDYSFVLIEAHFSPSLHNTSLADQQLRRS